MRSSPVRLIVAALLAIPVALGLFAIMHKLIDRDFQNPEVKNTKVAELVQPDEEITLEAKVEKPEEVDDPEEPPPEMEQLDLDLDVDVDVVNIAPTAKIDVNIGAGGGLSNDGEYLPIVKVAPIYPRRAQSRGITGYCIVEYTVTTSGAIRDPKPVDCQPPGVFDKASVKASLKFKYKPRVVDGQAIEVPGVQNKFTYELEQ